MTNDQALITGLQYHLKYCGSIRVIVPMRSLTPDQRNTLVKECINRVCVASQGISCSRVKNLSHNDKTMIDGGIDVHPNLIHGGNDVVLTLTTEGFTMTAAVTGSSINSHSIDNISFAAQGENETVDFMAYVAKDDHQGRYCYVLECGTGKAQEIVMTCGQAFTQRFDQSIQESPSLSLDAAGNPQFNYENGSLAERAHSAFSTQASGSTRRAGGAGTVPSPMNGFASVTESQRDSRFTPTSPIAYANFMLLLKQSYYHDMCSRDQAEQLISHEGEFLVRRSPNDPNQFVLSGMQSGTVRHLLLIDGQGVIQTRDNTFVDIVDLIDFHRKNNIAISSPGSALHLLVPVKKV